MLKKIAVITKFLEAGERKFGFLRKTYDLTIIDSSDYVAEDVGRSRVTVLFFDALLDEEYLQNLLDQKHSGFSVIFNISLSSRGEERNSFKAVVDLFFDTVSEEELSLRLEKLILQFDARIKASDELKFVNKESKSASHAFMMAMSDASVQGYLNRFLVATMRCNTYEQIMIELGILVKELEIICSYQIRGKQNVLNSLAPSARVNKEIEILCKQNQEKIVRYKDKLVVSTKHITILAKKISAEDADNYGRLMDTLAFLVDGVDARILSLDLEEELIDAFQKSDEGNRFHIIAPRDAEVMAVMPLLSPRPVFCLNFDGELLKANPAALELFDCDGWHFDTVLEWFPKLKEVNFQDTIEKMVHMLLRLDGNSIGIPSHWWALLNSE